MKVLRQLGLLLWKNALLKWRTGSVRLCRSEKCTCRLPIFLILEVLWPAILFLIIVVLRLQFPPEERPDAVYRANALPSAGPLPFMQTVMCDLGGGKTDDVRDMPHYPNASVNKVYSLLDEVGSLDDRWSKVCSGLRTLSTQAACTSLVARWQGCQHHGQVVLRCLLSDPTKFDSVLRDAGLNQTIIDAITNASISSQAVSSPNLGSSSLLTGLGGGALAAYLVNPGGLRFLLCDSTVLDQFVTFGNNVSASEVSSAVCSLNNSEFSLLSDQLREQLGSGCSSLNQLQGLRDLVSLEQALAVFQLGNSSLSLDPSSSSSSNSSEMAWEEFFCGEEGGDVRELQSTLTRVILGNSYQQAAAKNNEGSGSGDGANNVTSPSIITLKILYAPNTTLTQSVMKKANRTFETVDFIQTWSQQVVDCSSIVLDNDNFSADSTQVQYMRLVIDYLLSNDSNQTFGLGVAPSAILSTLRENQTLDRASLLQAQTLLDPNATNNIWNILTRARDTAEYILSTLALFDWDIFMPMESEEELVDLAADYDQQKDHNITTVAAGIVFDDTSDPERTASVRIRMNSTYVHDTTLIRESVWRPGPENQGWKRRYLDAWFIFIQDMVERALVEELSQSRVATPGVYLHQMPYPCYNQDKYTRAMVWVLPLAMIFAWLFPVAMTIRGIVHEKELRLKEYMKMMGLGEGVLRGSWFITAATILSVSVIITTFLLKVGNILVYSDSFIIFLYLMIYAVAMISYCFLVSVFFTNANLAACVGALLYFMVFFAHVTLIPKEQDLSPYLLTFCCLWAPLAFSLGMSHMIQFEMEQVGVHWDNVLTSPIQDVHLSFVVVCVMLVVDTLLYLLLTWYIEEVYTGKYGVAKPFYFPFMPSYWLGQRGRGMCVKKRGAHHVRLEEEGMEEEEEDGVELMATAEQIAVCEDEPAHLSQGITIQHLTKWYTTGLWGWRKHVQAVKDLSLNFYEGQITALLGHNGAGKTTTMSVVTGLFEPTFGTAYVYGNSIRRHMDIIRQSMGICPQHNILFDNITVKEHLQFFGMLKGLSWKEAQQQIPDLLSRVDLSPHISKLSQHLSGGMKRKLSILLAFVGDPQTIVLDEPTSGVDPYARRQIWDFLLRHREGRTIMLSTHHMDEAEILGDRIAIISNGSLLCCGSFEFLRHRFGRGHQLTLVTTSQSERRTSTTSHTFTVTAEVEDTDNSPSLPSSPTPLNLTAEDNVQNITLCIQGVIPSATLEEQRGRELRYLLPLHQSRPSVLSRLFKQLELQQGVLGVSSYGLTTCSMEEIFVQLTEEEAQKQAEDPSDATVPRHSLTSVSSRGSVGSKDTPANPSPTPQHSGEGDAESVFDEEGLLFGDTSCDDPLGSTEKLERLHIVRVWLSQYKALLVKRFHYTRHQLVALVVQNVLPLVIIALSLWIAHSLQTVNDQPSLLLSPSLFFNKSQDNYIFVGGYQTNKTEPYIQSLFRPCGVAADTLLSSTNHFSQCYYNPNASYPCSNYPQDQYHPCGCCNTENQTCDMCWNLTRFPSEVPSCYNGTRTGSRLQDVTVTPLDSVDPEFAYDTLTTYLLRSKASFIEQRYGGLSFGHEREEVDESVDTQNENENRSYFFATHSAAKVWYSLKGYHAMPAYLNTMNNAILRANLPTGADPSTYGIKTSSHPFGWTQFSKIFYAITERISFLVNPLAAIFSLGFVAAGFVLMVIEEQSKKIKHLQLVCGMNRTVYWLSHFTWDLLWFLAFALLMVVLYCTFQDPFYVSTELLPPFFLLLLSYGVAMTPWVYALSFIFSSPATAYVLLFCLNFFMGFALLIVDAILVYLEGTSASLVHWYLLVPPFPSYCLARGMMYFSLDRPLKQIAASLTNEPLPSPVSEIWPFIVSLCVQALVYTILLVLVELLPFLLRVVHPSLLCNQVLLPPVQDEDQAVAHERRKVESAKPHDEILTLNNLSKVYGGGPCHGKSRVAVNQLCLRMQKAECFGLLGVNGAGKTTTFRMLTGDTRASMGDAVIASHSIRHSLGQVQHSVGYCPQVDALIDPLTGRQHLILFSKLRGLPTKEVHRVVEWALLKLELMQYADKPAGTYSGGNRRKLSAAIALLAKPPLILLDEPTSGVDPRARHFLWSIIRGVVGAGQSVLLTTHSMAECEALCSRVGIMVNGVFRCLGTPQQLKSSYGEGYRLKVRADSGAGIEPLKEFVRQNFSSSILKEEHYNTLVYQLPLAGLKLSKAFELMENARETLDIQDYSISQTTLDDVFIHFANAQREEAGLCNSHEESKDSSHDNTQLPDVVAETSDVELVKFSTLSNSVTIH